MTADRSGRLLRGPRHRTARAQRLLLECPRQSRIQAINHEAQGRCGDGLGFAIFCYASSAWLRKTKVPPVPLRRRRQLLRCPSHWMAPIGCFKQTCRHKYRCRTLLQGSSKKRSCSCTTTRREKHDWPIRNCPYCSIGSSEHWAGVGSELGREFRRELGRELRRQRLSCGAKQPGPKLGWKLGRQRLQGRD
jgi:hypothetical protein